MRQLFLYVGTIILSGCTVIGIRNSEEAAHRVLYEEGNIQIRQYEEALIALTKTQGDYKKSGNLAFERLAGYIFGKNQSKEKIEMTTPVLEKNQSEKIAMTVPVYQQENNETWTMTFVLPSKYTLETIPEPLDKNVEIKTLPGKKVAAIKYAGFISTQKIEAKALTLQTWLEENDYKAISEPYSAAYDPPWTIPFFRRNEVHIEIE